MLFGFRWGSLRTKIIAWAFVPASIILLLVALVTFIAYQDVTEELVVERDRELTRLSAIQLASALTEYTDILLAETRSPKIYGGDSAAQHDALRQARNRLAIFDEGVVLLNTRGIVTATEPGRPELLGRNWSSRPYFRQMLRNVRPTFSDIMADGVEGVDVLAVAVPIISDQRQFSGALVGMFRVGATSVSAFYGDIVRLRIAQRGKAYLVDSRGRVIYHADFSHIGENFRTQPVVQRVLEGQVGATRTQDLDGSQIVAAYSPVPQTPWGLVTQTRWSTLIGASQRYRQFLILLLLLGVLVPPLVVSIGVERITQPITELITAAKKVADGNFNQAIITPTGDEIEQLAEQFNLMAVQLQASYTHLEQRVTERTKELAALNTISEVVSRSLELDQTLNDALDKTLEVLDLEAGGIYLLDNATSILNLIVHRGFSSKLVSEMDRLKIGEGFLSSVAETGEPLVVLDASTDPRLTRIVLREVGLRSLASVPLASKGRVLGILFAMTYGYREFSQQEIQLLSSIGHQVGVAIENTRLFEQAQELAAIEERGRLARELHDSVTQSLYSLTLLAEGWRRMAADGRLDEPVEPLSELGEIGQQALKEMRLLVYELRPPALEEEGLLGALHQRLAAVEKRAGMEARLLTQEMIELPAEIEKELYRIALEALNNTLKHAVATAVTVRIQSQNGHVTLEVGDNGKGFDPNSANITGGLGLASMRERAENLGGSLALTSTSKVGTTVRVVVPCG